MKSRMLMQLALAVAGVMVFFTPASVHADFMIDPNPGGQKLYNDLANKDVATFMGNVGGNGVGPLVTIDTIGNVDTGSGYSNIKPIKDGILTSLLFTPADGDLFDSFSFRGQLLDDANGEVKVTVQDNQGGSPESLTFTGLGKNSDFDRIGIIAVAGSGETIKWVKLESVFKEQKQNEFDATSTTTNAVPEPASCILFGVGSLGLVGYGWRRQKQHTQAAE